MKNLILLLFIFVIGSFQAQTFHFVDTSTTLIKDVTQSPAHWYIEIYSDVQTDTALRWKAEFENVPSQWNINFDTQSTYDTGIQSGDSNDFTLFAPSTTPQKLIIGAQLNNRPGKGTVHFDIFDPALPDSVQRISFEFIVTGSTNELKENPLPQWSIQNGEIVIAQGHSLGKIECYDLSGKLLDNQIIGSSERIQFPMVKSPVILLFYDQKGEALQSKLIR